MIFVVSKGNFDARGVKLSYSWVGAVPSGVTVHVSLEAGYIQETGAAMWKLTLQAESGASTGNFILRVTGAGGGVKDSIDITLTIGG